MSKCIGAPGHGSTSTCSGPSGIVAKDPPTEAPAPTSEPEPQNPDPRRFSIGTIYERGKKRNRYAAVLVEYPGCTNYEGKKVLVFKGVSKKRILEADKLDPHFCDHKGCISPVARFEPTHRGWGWAVEMVDRLHKD